MGTTVVVDDDLALAEMLGIVLHPRASTSPMSPTAPPPSRPSGRAVPTWSCSTSCCRAWTASRSVGGSAPSPACRSSCSPPAPTPSTSWWGWSPAPTTTSSPFKPQELIARVRLDCAGDEPAQERLSIGDLEIDVAGHSVRRGESPCRSPRWSSTSSSRWPASPGRCSAGRSSSSRCGATGTPATPGFVNVHVQRLRSKIEHDPERPEIVVTVRGVGWQGRPGLTMSDPRPGEASGEISGGIGRSSGGAGVLALFPVGAGRRDDHGARPGHDRGHRVPSVQPVATGLVADAERVATAEALRFHRETQSRSTTPTRPRSPTSNSWPSSWSSPSPEVDGSRYAALVRSVGNTNTQQLSAVMPRAGRHRPPEELRQAVAANPDVQQTQVVSACRPRDRAPLSAVVVGQQVSFPVVGEYPCSSSTP